MKRRGRNGKKKFYFVFDNVTCQVIATTNNDANSTETMMQALEISGIDLVKNYK